MKAGPRRRALAAAAVAAASLPALAGCAPAGAAAPARNVILITVDTLRADRLGSYGARRMYTPAFDSLAADGVLFESAFSLTPLTAPSHASMLTGRYPLTHGVRLNGGMILPEQETTLAEVARQRGLRTAAIVSCLVLASRFGINQGFDLYYEEGIAGQGEQRGLWFEERKAVRSVDRAIRWLRSESDKPFFLWLHLFDPHHPYDPPPPFKKNYAGRLYDGEVIYTDRALGRFLQEIKALGVYDNSLIILAGDHGESLGEHQEAFHGIFVYDATTHVPLIVRAPGGRRGARVSDIASLADVFPTALEALGAPIPADLAGYSLMPAVMGSGRVPARSLYLESVYPNATFGWAEVKAVRTQGLKYVEAPRPELFDLAEDARELNNIHDKDPRKLQAARSEYREVTERLDETARKETETADLDDDFRNRLLSLGYIAGTPSKARRGVARDPKDVILLAAPIGFGRQLTQERRYDEAIKILTEAVAADPENKIGLMNLGQAFDKAGRRAEAKATFRRALEVYPDAEEIYRLLGWMHVEDGEYEEAADLMAQLVHQAPRSSQAHYLYGFMFFRARQWGRALDAFEHARSLNPGFSKTSYLMAICYEQTGRRAQALRSLDEYLRLEPDVESLFKDPYFAGIRVTPEFASLIRRFL